MNFQQLRYVVAVAEVGSFGEAARHCHVTQPTLSNGVAQLEEELGGQFFERTTRSVKLTEFGQLLLPRITDVLNAQALLLAKAKEGVNSTHQHLSIGVSPIFGSKLANVILEPFWRNSPQIKIIFREINLTEMMQMMAQGDLDFVFGPYDPAAKREQNATIIRLFEEELRFIISEQTPEREHAVTLKEIANHALVMVPDACGLTQLTRNLFRKNKLKMREYAGQAMSYNILLDWALMGIGAAILPLSKLPAQTGMQIQISKSKSDIVKIGYQVSWHEKAKLSPPALALATYLKNLAPQFASGLDISAA
jgi:LysR family transcriptional regulator, hydrogen peroxide-inducible genes activator